MSPTEQAASNVSRRRALALAAAGLGACATGALGGYWWLNRDERKSAASAGELGKLLNASFNSLEDKPTPISTWRGKTLLVNFWATWCAPCREEMPDFVKAQAAYAAKGLQIIGLAVDRKAPVERFARELAINYPILMADPAWLDELKTMGNPQGVLPFSVVFGPSSDVMLVRVGKIKYSEISTIMS